MKVFQMVIYGQLLVYFLPKVSLMLLLTPNMESVYVTIVHPAFCPFLYLTVVHF